MWLFMQFYIFLLSDVLHAAAGDNSPRKNGDSLIMAPRWDRAQAARFRRDSKVPYSRVQRQAGAPGVNAGQFLRCPRNGRRNLRLSRRSTMAGSHCVQARGKARAEPAQAGVSQARIPAFAIASDAAGVRMSGKERVRACVSGRFPARARCPVDMDPWAARVSAAQI